MPTIRSKTHLEPRMYDEGRLERAWIRVAPDSTVDSIRCGSTESSTPMTARLASLPSSNQPSRRTDCESRPGPVPPRPGPRPIGRPTQRPRRCRGWCARQGAAHRRVVVVVVEEQSGDDLCLPVTRPARRCLRDRHPVADDDDPDRLLESMPRDGGGRRHAGDAEDEGRRVAQVPGRETSEGDTKGHSRERKGHVSSQRADAGEPDTDGRAAGVEPGDHAQKHHSGRDDWLQPQVAGEDDAHAQRGEDLGEQECPRAVHQPTSRRCGSPKLGSDEGAVQVRVDRAGRDGGEVSAATAPDCVIWSHPAAAWRPSGPRWRMIRTPRGAPCGATCGVRTSPVELI